MSQIDPTDHALAAIASIMDQPESAREAETASPPETQAHLSDQLLAEAPVPPPLPVPALEVAEVDETPLAEETPLAPAAVDAAGYCKVGPGPMEAIRFKWTVRRDDAGQFFVDETIGANSTPLVTGPMSSDEAIHTVDARESEARLRFEQIKAEMTTRTAAASLVRNDSGEM